MDDWNLAQQYWEPKVKADLERAFGYAGWNSSIIRS